MSNGEDNSEVMLAKVSDWNIILRETKVDKVFNGVIRKVKERPFGSVLSTNLSIENISVLGKSRKGS